MRETIKLSSDMKKNVTMLNSLSFFEFFFSKKTKYPTFTQERKPNYYFSFHPAIVIKHAKLVNRIIHVLASLIVPSVLYIVYQIYLVFFSYEKLKTWNIQFW